MKNISYYGILTNEPFLLTKNQAAIFKHLVYWIKTAAARNGIFECYQSVRDIEKRTGITNKTIQSSLKKLIDIGFIYKEVKKRHWQKYSYYSLTNKGYITLLIAEPFSIFYEKIRVSEQFFHSEPFQILTYEDFLSVITETKPFSDIYEKHRQTTMQRNDKGNGFDILPFSGNACEIKEPKKEIKPQSIPKPVIQPIKPEPVKKEPYYIASRKEKREAVYKFFNGYIEDYKSEINQIFTKLEKGGYDLLTTEYFLKDLRSRFPTLTHLYMREKMEYIPF